MCRRCWRQGGGKAREFFAEIPVALHGSNHLVRFDHVGLEGKGSLRRLLRMFPVPKPIEDNGVAGPEPAVVAIRGLERSLVLGFRFLDAYGFPKNYRQIDHGL